MSDKARMFPPGCVVRAFRWDGRAGGHMEIATVTRHLAHVPGCPYGLVATFTDGTQQTYYFAYSNIRDPRRSLVTHFVPEFTTPHVKGFGV